MIKSDKYWKIIYTLIPLFGICMLIYGITLYELTFISINILLFIMFLFSIPTYFLIRDHYAKLYSVGKHFYPICISITSTGFIFVTFFLIINYHFSDIETENRYVLSINKIGKLAGRGETPYAEVYHDNKTKKILFKHKDVIKRNNSICIKTLQGFLGFEVIIEKKII